MSSLLVLILFSTTIGFVHSSMCGADDPNFHEMKPKPPNGVSDCLTMGGKIVPGTCYSYQGVDVYNAEGKLDLEGEDPEWRQFRARANLEQLQLRKAHIDAQSVETNITITYEVIPVKYHPGIARYTTPEKIADQEFIVAGMPKFLGCERTKILNHEQFKQSMLSVDGHTTTSINITTTTDCSIMDDETPSLSCTLCISLNRANEFVLMVDDKFAVVNLPGKWALHGAVKTLNQEESEGTLEHNQALIKFVVRHGGKNGKTEL